MKINLDSIDEQLDTLRNDLGDIYPTPDRVVYGCRSKIVWTNDEFELSLNLDFNNNIPVFLYKTNKIGTRMECTVLPNYDDVRKNLVGFASAV